MIVRPRPPARTSPHRAVLALAGALALSLTVAARGDVKLPGLFSDHMVLQQGMRVAVWGWADEGETVTVEFRGQKKVTTAEHGRWKVHLEPLKAGGPDLLKIKGNNLIEIQEVLVGEVWICSGQSNMEWPLSRSFESQPDVAGAENYNIRLFTVPKLKAKAPVDDVAAKWQQCNPQTVPNFTAVGYYFGRALQKARNVPVGLIHTSWGGSPAEVWMSEEALSADPDFQRDILDTYPAAWRAFQKTKEDAEKEHKPAPWPPWRPTELYNGMIAPLVSYGIRGAIWYQGESNAGRAFQYRKLFADMIRDWRNQWKQGDFTFLAVQLAPWDKAKKRTMEQITEAPVESDWAELREAQDYAAKNLLKVGIAVITDVGDKDDIHPTKKVPVGERLALAARSIAYGEKINGFGPTYRSVSFMDAQAIVHFNHVGRGLEARGGELQGFAVAGPDKKFVWAKAEIRGNTVVVTSPTVPKPIAVRYGWADYPVVNLWNRDGLPASPFRTDKFPMLTEPKK